MPEIPISASFDAKACFAEIQIANELANNGQIELSIEHYRAALTMDPKNSLLHDDLVYLLSFHPEYSDQRIAEELRKWEQQHGGLQNVTKGNSAGTKGNTLRLDGECVSKKLKIGYVSPEFCRQAESHFVIPLLETHHHEQFGIHCYSSTPKADDRTERIRKAADVWHEVRTLNDEELAEQIARDEIDVLVDLTMHMRNSRMLMFARKPAPVQVAWLAYPGSTGLRVMDYRFSDRFLDPPGEKSPFVESAWVLPDCWVVYDPLAQSALAPPKANRPITFGSLNHSRKMNDVNLRLWARTMKQVDGSRIIVKLESPEHRARARGVFENEGIGADRLEFVGWLARWEYLRCYDRIDIALDTLPYNGITTTCDALWMGTPVVSLVGNTIAGRAGLGLLSTVGLGELVATSEEQFMAIAAGLARDRARMAEFRKGLRQRIESSPVMDARRFAGNVEGAYQEMLLRSMAKGQA
jgi:predicted O-linked N-acetylglucosamine transferase (SPINDLY family)